jgi:hypothetical protein
MTQSDTIIEMLQDIMLRLDRLECRFATKPVPAPSAVDKEADLIDGLTAASDAAKAGQAAPTEGSRIRTTVREVVLGKTKKGEDAVIVHFASGHRKYYLTRCAKQMQAEIGKLVGEFLNTPEEALAYLRAATDVEIEVLNHAIASKITVYRKPTIDDIPGFAARTGEWKQTYTEDVPF